MYELSANNTWTQLGGDIDGEAADDESGWSVSLSADGRRVAIGARFNDDNGNNSGHVRVYELSSNNTWTQLGGDIDGEAADDESGYSVSLSSDGSRVAIGARRNDGNGRDAGHVRVYELDTSNAWSQLGGDIDGEAARDQSGYSVSLSSDGSRVAIGARYNDVNGSDAGHVRVYELDTNNTWSQLGGDIDGEASGDWSGYTVSLSANGSRVAIGARKNDGNGRDAGHVRVYELSSNNTWTQLGGDIDGEAAGDGSGWSVSLSAHGSRVAIGAPGNDGNGSTSGHVRVYELDTSNNWSQLGSDIDGEAGGDRSGNSVSLSADGSQLAIGAWANNGNGSRSGHVRVFSIGLKLTNTFPSPDTLNVAANTLLSLVFSDSVLASSVNADNFHFFGEQSGCLAGSFSGGGTDSIVFTPSATLFPGEVVRVTVDSGIQALDSSRLLNPQSYEFRVKSGTIADPAFASRVISDTASRPYGVYAADIDDDGDIDILAASGNSDRVAWYENLGQGSSFRGHTISDTAEDARAVHAADIDCDGDMDVLSASFDDSKIALYTNDGSENFSETVLDTSLSGALQLMTSDADRDGDLDILAAGINRPGVVTWYLQDSAGGFSKSIVDTALLGAFSIHPSDLDGDGDIDMLAVGELTDALIWYENDGSQNYTVDTLTNSVNDPRDVYAADFDGDGDQDIVVAASQFDIIAYLRNDGNLNFTQSRLTQNVDLVYDLHAADMDGDGDADVVSASLFDDKVAIFENDGQGNFTERIVTQSADGALSVYPADIDGDGILDIVSAALNGDEIAWHAQKPRFALDTTYPAHAVANIARDSVLSLVFTDSVLTDSLDSSRIRIRGEQTGLYAGTFSGGGTDSIVFTPDSSFKPGEVIRVTIDSTLLSINGLRLEQDVSFSFQTASDAPSTHDFVFQFNEVSDTSDAARAVHAADLDGDGDLDIVGASRDDDRVVWFENDGNQNFTGRVITSSADGAIAVYVEDVDSDGDLDVLSASRNDNTIAWYENNGSQQFTTRTIDNSANEAFYVHTADIDGDGDVDVLATARSDDEVIWYENDGNQSFTRQVIDNFLDGAVFAFPADIDRDGDLDVVAGGIDADEVVWYENDGQQNFTEIRVTNQADAVRGVYADDVDQDGDMDLLHAARDDDEIAWWENDGSQSFTKRSLTTNADGARYARTADVDGDGDLDIVGVSFNDDKVAWWENDGAQNFTENVISTGFLDAPTNLFTADLDDDGILDILTTSFRDDRISWFKIVPRFAVDTVYPAPAANNIARDSVLSLVFTDSVLTDSLDSRRIRVRGEQTGLYAGTFTGGGADSIVFTPDSSFKPGEVIRVTITTKLYSDNLVALDTAYSFEFRAASHPVPFSDFVFQPQIISDTTDFARWGHPVDLDQDGDIDVLVASRDDSTYAWYENDGNQNFTGHILNNQAAGAITIMSSDVDSDGDIDVVAASRFGDTVVWFENDGNENFTESTVTTSVDGPVAVFATDVDGDGDIDIMSASRSDDRIAWYENDGSQNFTQRIVDNSLNDAASVHAADMDNDGDIDMLGAGHLGNQIRLYENDGRQGFTSTTVTTNTALIWRVYAVDIDEDGFLDLLSTSETQDKISWHRNDGQNNFTEDTISLNADEAFWVHAADVDGDGDQDVISTARNDNKVSWHENDGNENFTERFITNNNQQSRRPKTVFTTDLDDNGILDFLVTAESGDDVVWYSFKPRFAVDTVYPAPAANNIARDSVLSFVFTDSVLTDSLDSRRIRVRGEQTGLYTGTFTGGGTDSIVFTPDSSFKPGEVIRVTITDALLSDDRVTLRNDFSFEFRVNSKFIDTTERVFATQRIDTAKNPESVHAADLDADGDMDVLRSSGGDSTFSWYENDGSGRFTPRLILDTLSGASTIRAADMDRDGDLDLLVAVRNSAQVAWLENDGAQNFTFRSIGSTPANTRIALPVDLDGDGDLDAVACDNTGGEVAWFENDGTQNFTKRSLENTTGDLPWDLYISDTDQDGDLDILVAYRNADEMRLFENDGSERFTIRTVSRNTDNAMGAYAIDIDDDTDIDLLSASRDDDRVAWYDAPGATQQNITTAANGARHVYATDLNGDGFQDVLSANLFGDHFNWYLNDGQQSFVAREIAGNADGAAVIYAADFDGDSIQDVLTASRLDGVIAWHKLVKKNEISLVANDATIANDDLSPSTADSTDFGVAYVGANPVRVRYKVFNELDQPLSLNGNPQIALSSGTAFSLARRPTNNSLQPGDSTFFVLEFYPSSTGTFTDTVRIATDGPAPDPFRFVIEGEGRPCPALQANATVTSISCADSTDGAIDLSPSGGVSGPYAHRWNTTDTTEDLTRLAPGTYTDTLADAEGCRDTFSFTLNAPSALRLQASADSVTCPGGSDGRIDLTVSGGTPGYAFQWADKAATEDRSGLDTGAYRVTITDANNCPADTALFVGQEDVQAPVARAQNLTAQLDASGQATITASLVDDGSSDNCAIVSRRLSQSQFSCSDRGANTVTLTVVDADGNRDQATATITVEDNIAPQLTTQNIRVQLDAAGQATITPADVETSASDNCGIVSRTLSPTTFDCSDRGPNTATLTVEDAAGNRTTRTAIVTVEDTTAPQAVARDLTVQLDSSGQAVITPNQIANGASDNCAVTTRRLSRDTFDCAALGANTVTFYAEDAAGNIDSATATVTIRALDLPQPAFSVAKSCVNEDVLLVDSSAVGATTALQSVDFDFDNDGTFDTTAIAPGDTVATQYPDTGLRTVAIRSTAQNGCVVTVTQTLEVFPIPRPGFRALEGCEGQATVFTDTSRIAKGRVSQVAFDFEDDGIFDRTGLAGGATVSFQYPSAGNKDVGLRATSDQGCTATIVEVFGVSKTVQVNPNPDPAFSATAVCAYDSVPILDASTITSGTIDSLVYDLDDDGVFERQVNAGESLQAKFSEGGRFSIGVFAESDAGCVKLILDTVAVNAVPRPGFVVTENCTGDSTAVADTSGITLGRIDSIAVDFDDDGRFEARASGPGDTLKTRYFNFNPQAITLKATSDAGCVAEVRRTVDFAPQPVVAFTSEPACLGQATRFQNQSVLRGGSITAYHWRFDDGGSSQRANPRNIFPATGNYDVSLEAIGDNGCRDTAIRRITVSNTPAVAFSLRDTCRGDTVTVRNQTQSRGAGPLNYRWDLGDGRFRLDSSLAAAYDSSGRYTVQLTATSARGCADSARQLLDIKAIPRAIFAVDTVCRGEETRFLNSSVGAAGYAWDFGDGTTARGLSPRRRYAAADTYRVRLVASSAFGCRDTANQAAVVRPIPVADFTVRAACRDDSLRFQNTSQSAVRYRWELDDNATSTAASPVQAYAQSGPKNIQLIAEAASGCRDTATATVEVYPEPVAAFRAADACQGDTIAFQSQSLRADGLRWSFGDGAATTSNQTNPGFAYARAGRYAVTLEARTSQGCVDTARDTVEVSALPRTDFSVAAVCAGAATTFQNTSQGASQYRWAFGDGSTSRLASPRRTYAAADTYAVQLIGLSARGCRDTATAPAVVHPVPTAAFSVADACQADSIRFQNQSQGAGSYQWNFGDGRSATAPDPVIRYTQAGDYSVQLTAASSEGCRDSAVQTVSIYPQPEADFSFQNVCVGEATVFSDQSRMARGRYQAKWMFGSALDSSTAANPSYTFPDSGSYGVVLALTSDEGCRDRVRKTVAVYGLPEPAFGLSNICAGDTAQIQDQSQGVATYQWDLGDGRSRNGAAPRPVYANAGRYRIALSAQSAEGCRADTSATLVVNPRPRAALATSRVCAYDSARPLNRSRGAAAYRWDFGDGSGVSQSPTPAYQYAAPGAYPIQLIARSDSGCVDTARGIQRVDSVPQAGFAVAPVCRGAASAFQNQSSGNASRFDWQLGDGFNSREPAPAYNYTSAGRYPVRLIATSAFGCRDTARDTATVHALPAPAFTASSVCSYDSTVFENQSQNATAYSWDFGDGQGASQDRRPTYFYGEAGRYPVDLTAISSEGCRDSLRQFVAVKAAPQAGFSLSDVCAGGQVRIEETASRDAVGFGYDLGDGRTRQEARPVVEYPTAGSYRLQQVVTNAGGCVDTAREDLTIHPVPEAAFSASDVCFGEEVAFANASRANGAARLDYRWDFGTGEGSTAENPGYNYPATGVFAARLAVTSENGCADSVTQSLRVSPHPVAGFEVEAVCEGRATALRENTRLSGGSVTAYRWRLGDGQRATGAEVEHTYAGPGNYPVELVAISDRGCRDSLTREAVVHPRAEAAFAADTVCYGAATSFDYAGEAEGRSLRWDFGDGQGSSMAAAPDYTYFNPGTYRARLEVVSEEGCRDSSRRLVEVYRRPIADFAVDPNVCVDNEVAPQVDAAGEIAAYRWRFDDGVTRQGPTPRYPYPDTGAYDIQLTVENGPGCRDSVVRRVRVRPRPAISITGDTSVSKGYAVELEAGGARDYAWQPTAGLSDPFANQTQARPLETTTYRVVGRSLFGCAAEAEVRVEVANDFRLEPVNTFTPNGDGMNERFVVGNITQYPGCRVRVYDRYGREVYQRANYQNDWAGADASGNPLPQGTYYYTVDCPGDAPDYKGAVTILR